MNCVPIDSAGWPAEAREALAALELQAGKLGKRAWESALNSGDLDEYENSDQLDEADLCRIYWNDGPYQMEMQDKLDEIPAPIRSTLPPDGTLLDHLFHNAFLTAWQEDDPASE